MGYEDAPATAMLATHCAVCSRPLLDAASVNAGMGPDCRRKHGYNVACSDEDRAAANREIQALANPNILPEYIGPAIARIRALGFEQLAKVLEHRRCDVAIEDHGDELRVSAPYNDAATIAWRAIPGRRWDRESKVNVIVVAGERLSADDEKKRRAMIWGLLRRFYAGRLLSGPKGVVAIPSE